MGLIDTHTHLESFERRGELAAIYSRARAAGLDAMITVGTSPEDWPLYQMLAGREVGFIYYTAGLHPCAVTPEWPAALASLESYWQGDGAKPVALGEIGLDRFHLPAAPTLAEAAFTEQRAAFAAGLELARKLACPVVVHSRQAFAECVEMIDASGVAWSRVVFHCFSEGAREMQLLRERGGVGSFTGIITYKKADEVRAAAQAQGLEHLMIETDAPYLAPVPHRGKSNEPAFLKFTAQSAATVMGVDEQTLERRTTENARRFFGI